MAGAPGAPPVGSPAGLPGSPAAAANHPPLPTRTPGEHAFGSQSEFGPPEPERLPTRTPGETPLPGQSAADGPPPGEPARPPRQRQPGTPVYGDLLQMTAPPATAPAEAAGWPGLAEPRHQPFLPPQPPPASGPPVSGESGAAPPSETAPPGEPTDEPPARSGPSTGVIVGAVLIGATLLVLGALSVPFLLQYLSNRGGDGEFSVGECVVQDGLNARTSDCSAPDAYQVVSQVSDADDCEDPTQPTIEAEGPPVQFYCLRPVDDGSPPAE